MLRGQCNCGAFDFWQREPNGSTRFAPRVRETPTGLILQTHIFTADKGDYCAITDSIAPKET